VQEFTPFVRCCLTGRLFFRFCRWIWEAFKGLDGAAHEAANLVLEALQFLKLVAFGSSVLAAAARLVAFSDERRGVLVGSY